MRQNYMDEVDYRFSMDDKDRDETLIRFKALTKIVEQPSMESESIDSLEDMRRKGVNDIGMDSSSSEEVEVKTRP